MKTGHRSKNRSSTSSRSTTTSVSQPTRNGSIPVELVELIEISQAVGRDPDLVQGGGGNTSVKSADGTVMYIKTSGTLLADMNAERGWAQLSLPETLAVMQPGLADLPAAEREARVLQQLQLCVVRPFGARPSVESNLHALLGRVVIHTHPVGLNVLLCSRASRARLGALIRDVLGEEHGEPLHVPYVDPGYTLAARVAVEIAAYSRQHGKLPTIVTLENHGLFVAANTAAAALKTSSAITAAGRAWSGLGVVNSAEAAATVAVPLDPAAAPAGLAEVRGALLRGGSAPLLLRRDDSAVARSFLAAPGGALALAGKGTFTPDQIVYCRAQPLILDGAVSEWPGKVAAYRQAMGLDPRVVIVKPEPRKGVVGGVIYAAPDLQQLGIVGDVYRSALAVLVAAKKAGGPRFLEGAERAFIESWEVEKFRAALLGGANVRLQGKIAAVTGAASGLGKGIARGLTGAGATVLALDLNQGALQATQAEMPRGKYLPCPGDVTSEESMAQAFRTLEASLGGIDILVNAAGIAPSFPLTEFPLGAWRKTLEINLTGYFLCAREAVRMMKRQAAGGCIINLTSKSGLDASKENSAYNATKAGEIHLMRGWALELGKDGIRANCIAPGNVFKGSQIWSEEYIRACARKKGIKPEEVIPYYTSLAPLGKEIEPEDISNAVVFLVSDEARNITGQTLVVDGGQVMVR